jgi:hypothetical protein
MKKFLAIIILMGHVKEDTTRIYSNISKLIETPVFGKLMSRNRFEQIWNFWHYSDNSTLDDEADRLYKIEPILYNLVHEFRKHYRPPQELSLDEAMIPWRGRLGFRTYNPSKLVLKTGYTDNMEICTEEGKKLEEPIFSVLEPYHDLWHHVHQDNYCYNVEISEKLLLKKTRVCETIRANGGLL